MAFHGHHVLGRRKQIDGWVQMPLITGGTNSPLKLSRKVLVGEALGGSPQL